MKLYKSNNRQQIRYRKFREHEGGIIKQNRKQLRHIIFILMKTKGKNIERRLELGNNIIHLVE